MLTYPFWPMTSSFPALETAAGPGASTPTPSSVFSAVFSLVAMFSSRLFFSSRRRHTRYWRDWSSDVCSSDLVLHQRVARLLHDRRDEPVRLLRHAPRHDAGRRGDPQLLLLRRELFVPDGRRRRGDRKSVVEGKSVDLGGSRIIKKQNNLNSNH